MQQGSTGAEILTLISFPTAFVLCLPKPWKWFLVILCYTSFCILWKNSCYASSYALRKGYPQVVALFRICGFHLHIQTPASFSLFMAPVGDSYSFCIISHFLNRACFCCEDGGSSEMLTPSYQTTWYHNLEDHGTIHHCHVYLRSSRNVTVLTLHLIKY